MEIWKCFPSRISQQIPPNSFRIMGTHSFRGYPGATDEWGSRGGHPRSNEVAIRFSPITRNRMEIEARKWCQRTWLVKPLRKICILTYFGHDLALTCPWSWPDLAWPEVRFWNWSFKVKKYIFWTGATWQTWLCHFYFLVSHQKIVNEKPSPWKTIIFPLMISGAKTVALMSNLIQKQYWGMKRDRAIQCSLNSS